MEEHIVKLKSIGKVTHDVLELNVERPAGYDFVPGQATEVAINKPGWDKENRPFTFTGSPAADFLQFTIKTYPSHQGVTNKLLDLQPGDELILHDVWGAISYKGEGTFIAGGAGVTPFLSIFRDLRSRGEIGNNRLIFANKTEADIIQKEELSEMLGTSFVNILSDEKKEGFGYGFITEEFLKENIRDLNGKVYLCGPPPMMNAIQGYLKNLGVGEEALVVEI